MRLMSAQAFPKHFQAFSSFSLLFPSFFQLFPNLCEAMLVQYQGVSFEKRLQTSPFVPPRKSLGLASAQGWRELAEMSRNILKISIRGIHDPSIRNATVSVNEIGRYDLVLPTVSQRMGTGDRAIAAPARPRDEEVVPLQLGELHHLRNALWRRLSFDHAGADDGRRRPARELALGADSRSPPPSGRLD